MTSIYRQSADASFDEIIEVAWKICRARIARQLGPAPSKPSWWRRPIERLRWPIAIAEWRSRQEAAHKYETPTARDIIDACDATHASVATRLTLLRIHAGIHVDLGRPQ